MTDIPFLNGIIKASQYVKSAGPDHVIFSHAGTSMEFYGTFSYNSSEKITGELNRIIQYDSVSSGGKDVIFEWIGRADASMIYKMFHGNALYPYGAVSYLLSGDDIIKGSSGNDILIGGAGNDYLIGGGGRDVFVYQLTGNGVDTIADVAVGDIIRVSGAIVAGVRATVAEGTTLLTISTETAPHTPIVINLKGAFTPDHFLIRGSDLVVVEPSRAAAVPAGPAEPPAAASPEKTHFDPPAKDRPGNPLGEIWHLMTLLIDARQGCVAPMAKVVPLGRDQVEALWDNILNGWSIGPLVAVDTTGAETMPWPCHFGPWLTQPKRGKRIRLAGGAEKVIALAWSLTEPSVTLRNRFSAEETEIWSGFTLVVDTSYRRVGFVKGPVDTRRQLPVWLMPQTKMCLDALNQMDVTPLEREWLNRTARRLLEFRVSVHLFPAAEQDAAQRMVGNFRQFGPLS
ncbi:MAG: calcium-binding protein [Rhodospirillaceae bacterium]